MSQELDIDKFHTRQQLAATTPIESTTPIPPGIASDEKATITIGNYIGWETREDGMPDLEPIIQALIFYASMIASENQENRLLALARTGALHRSPHYIREALKPAIVQVDKKDGEYTLSKRQAFGVGRAIKANKVIWGSPAQTTDDNGLKTSIKTGLVRFARKYETNLAVLGVELDQNAPEKKIPKKLHVEQIPIPSIIYDPPRSEKHNDEIKLNKLANESITLYLMAYIASLLPENQRGEFQHIPPEDMMQKQIWQLVGMQRDGLYVSGSFLEEEITPTPISQPIESESYFQRFTRKILRRGAKT